MKLKFSGRTALITGGSGGIGLSIVKKLIKNKIKVIILDINTPSKKILLNKFIEFKKIDLSDYKNLQLCLTELKKKYKIKLIEKELGNIEGSSSIKSKISKARRALKGKNPNREKANKFWKEALTIFDKEMQWRQILKPGQLLIFNNWRVLHGRSEFSGKRKMSGCYINKEDFESVCRINSV